MLSAQACGNLKNTVDTVISIINFICSTSSLQSRLFCLILDDTDAEHSDLLFHNDIRQISKGKALNRFCELRQDILTFLKLNKNGASRLLEQMMIEKILGEVHFLCDIV